MTQHVQHIEIDGHTAQLLANGGKIEILIGASQNDIYLIINCICLAALVLCAFAAIRNEMVCRYRLKCIGEDWRKLDRLPSYDYMMYRFWVWNFDKFLKDENK